MRTKMQKFECHITCARDEWDKVNHIPLNDNWSFSRIDGDPIMGKVPYCYLTAFDTDPIMLLKRMNAVIGFLTENDIEVLRSKIEEILYDSKTGHDMLTVTRCKSEDNCTFQSIPGKTLCAHHSMWRMDKEI